MSQLLQTAQKEIIEDAVPVVLPKTQAKSLVEIRQYLFFMESIHQHKNQVTMSFLTFYHRDLTVLGFVYIIGDLSSHQLSPKKLTCKEQQTPLSGERCLAFIKMAQESGREILHSCRPEENLVVKTFSYLSKECLELMVFSCAQCSMGPGQAEPYCVS